MPWGHAPPPRSLPLGKPRNCPRGPESEHRLPEPADTLYHVPKRDQASDPATSHGPTKGGRLSRRR